MTERPSPGQSPPAQKSPDPGFGVYVHWPFCAAKCPYCDFNSHVRGKIDEPRFAAALARELAHMRALTGPRRVTSVFFGGGTPSLMAGETVAGILDAVRALWGLMPDAEVTLEANPTSVEAGRFAAYAQAGVNRLSIGVQALDDAALKALGRRHSAAEALDAVALARKIFARVSFDLIYARPGQNADDWQAELQRALALGPDHLSLYQLTIEEGTPFAALHAKGDLTLPGEGAEADMFALTQDICAAAGLPAYEISNHARPDFECRHNLTYWRYGDYVGAGPGAHGRVQTEGGRLATRTQAAPETWAAAVEAAGHGLDAAEPVSAEEAGTEYTLLALRLREGLSLSRFAALTGAALEPARIAKLAEAGLLAREGDRLTATPKGRGVLNWVLGQLLA